MLAKYFAVVAAALISSSLVSAVPADGTSSVPLCAARFKRCYNGLMSDKDAALDYCGSFVANTPHAWEDYPVFVHRCYGYAQQKKRQLNHRIEKTCSCFVAENPKEPDPADPDPNDPDPNDPDPNDPDPNDPDPNDPDPNDPDPNEPTDPDPTDPDPTDPDPTDPQTPQATTTLLPAIPLETDPAKYSNLVPKDSNMLYYAESSGIQNPYLKTQFLKMDANFTYPTVVLEYSQYVDAVTCDNDGIDVIFNDVEAFQTVKSSWKDLHNLVIVTFTDGCGESSEFTRTMWLASDIAFMNQGGHKWAEVTANEILTQKGLKDANLVWGTYTPGAPDPGNNVPGPIKLECADPPSSQIDGFPAAACGDNFDDTLDSNIGYYSFDVSNDGGQDFISNFGTFAPGLGLDQETRKSRLRARRVNRAHARRGRLEKRWFWDDIVDAVSDAISDIVDTVVDVVEGVVDCFADPIECAGDIVDAVVDAAGAAWDALGDLLSFDGRLDSPTFSLDVGLPGEAKSPWGDAFQIFKIENGQETEADSVPDNLRFRKRNVLGKRGLHQKPSSQGYLSRRDAAEAKNTTSLENRDLSASLAMYCVDCGIHGEATIYGGARFRVLELSLDSLYVGMNAGLTAEVNLGLVGGIEWSKEWSKALMTHGIDGVLAIPDILVVGPFIELSAEFDLSVELKGQVLAGAKMEIGPFDASFDFISQESKMTGEIEPKFTTRFEADAEMKVEAGFYMPVKIGIGILIPPIDFDESIAIEDKPGIKLELGASASFETGTGQEDDNNEKRQEEGGEEGGEGEGEGEGEEEEEEEEEEGDDECENGAYWKLSLVNNIHLKAFNAVDEPIIDWELPLAGQCYQFDPEDPTDPENPTDPDNPDDPGTPTGLVLTDNTGQYHVASPGSPSSNFFMSNAQSPAFFNTDSNSIVMSDSSERWLQFYPEMMSKYGVSRFRVTDTDHIPTGAEMVLLRQVPVGNTGKLVYMAFSTTGAMYYPVTCAITNGGQMTMKMFLAKNSKRGLVTLKNPELQWTVTGGVVHSCNYVPVKAAA